MNNNQSFEKLGDVMKTIKIENRIGLSFIFIFLLLVTACGNGGPQIGLGGEEELAPRIIEDTSIYDNDDPHQVHIVYVTIFATPPGSLQKYDFDDINSDENYLDLDNPELPILFQEGDLTGPRVGDYGYGINDSNGTIRIRGRSTRTAAQKSYRVNLNNRLGTWLGFDKINLNKHPYDITRFRNKLAFDIIREIENLPSLRTKFIHVFVKDLSQGQLESDFVDYGLFTHVEAIDDDYLDNHGLDQDGQIYKAENFFFQLDKNLRTRSDVNYNENKFEKVLSIQNGGDHVELIAMLKDINNFLFNINSVVNDHFQTDNYLTWLAVNILLDNRDTNTQNFMLYKPRDYKTFYFLPWDYDGAFDFYNQVKQFEDDSVPPWRLGLANYWSTNLHSRFFRNTENIERLNKRIDDLYYQLSEMDLPEMIDDYAATVYPYLSRDPDLSHLRGSIEQHLAETERLKNILDLNLKRYYNSLERPMPIFLGDATPLGEYSLFNWDRSYDFQDDALKYHFELSTTPTFDTILSEEFTNYNEVSVRNLSPGIYYWRVTVIDSKGHTQTAMDEFIDSNGATYHGIGRFILKEWR